MLKSIGLAAITSLGFYLLHAPLLSYIFAGIAAVLGIILFLLLMIEHRQDEINGKQTANSKKDKK
ncbi:MAG: hypothetical protein K0R46_2352 [Herbinix sp.]|nr:hypothetical protein [Herbinix sp.]